MEESLDAAVRVEDSTDPGPADDQYDDAPRTPMERLQAELRGLGRVVVAFSGGADSALLAWSAHEVLGADRCLVATAVSPSLADAELADCRRLAADWGLRLVEVETDEFDRREYRRNDPDRCFHCKDALMDALLPLAERSQATVVLGVNLDDLGDHRPGQRAARGRGARFPFVDAGFTKADVRAVSKRLGLVTWDKPSAPCLSSRVPYGSAVTLQVVDSVARAEASLRRLGFRELRVRHYDRLARIEVPLADLPRLLDQREAVSEAVHAAGYDYVTLDLEGLRSGNLNQGVVTDRPRRG